MASRSIDQSGILEADGTLPADFVVADNLANLSVTARTIDPSVTTDEITEGIANLYYTDNRARLAITVTGGGYYDNANGVITIGGSGLNTTNVIEGSNLYFTNARARAAISNIDSTIEYNPITGTIRANVIALGFGENVVTVQGQTGVVTLTTTDLPEGANLYFTNTRAQVAIRAGLGISINNGQVNVNPNANLIINEVSTSKLTVYDPGNTAANIELVYDQISQALVINSNVSPLFNEAYNLGTVGETFNDLYVKQIYANNITLSNTITADEFIGNVTGDLTKFILVSADNNSLLIDQSSNPDLFLPKGTKARVDLSSDALIGIGFDIGQYNAANNDIANGANLSGLSYYVNNQLVTGFTDWAASFNDANTRSIVYSIPQSAPFNLIYYSLQFTEWRGNITVAPPTDTDDLREGSLNFYYTDQRVDDRLFQVADGNVGLIFDQGTSLLTLAQDISTDAGVVFDNVTANAYYGNAFYGTLYGNIIGQLTDLNGLTTTELPEGANAYFTVSRVRTNVNAQNGITYSSITGMFELEPTNVIANFGNANIVYGNPNSTITIEVDEWGRIENVINRGIVISSSNVLEGANLFFTNARVVANVSNLSINVLADVDTTGAGVGQALVWNGSIWIPQTTISGNVTGTANIANLVSSLSNHTTSNLAEGANLYFTNARVWANVGANIGDLWSNIAGLTSGTGPGALTTSNVAEGANLYFTTDRVYANVITLNYANVTYVDAAIANLVNSAPATLDTLFELAAALGNDASFATTVLNQLANKANTASLTTANVIESGNLYFTNARVWANVGANIGYLWSNLNSITGGGTGGLTTSNVAEGANLYFTNARVLAALFNAQSNVANIAVNKVFVHDQIAFPGTGAGDYANIRLVDTGGGTTRLTFNVGDNSVDGIDFYVNSSNNGVQINGYQVWHAGNDGTGSGLDADLLDGQTSSYYASNAYVNSLTTTQIAEGANLYFSNARSRAAIGTANPTALIYYEGNGNFQVNVESVGAVTSVNGQTGAITLTTSNIAEGANLYFSNVRVQNYLGAVNGNIIPNASNLFDLGSSTARWRDLWLSGNSLYLGDISFHDDGSGNLRLANLSTGSVYNLIANTGSLAETQGKNFFSNTQARAAVGTANATSLIYYEANGNFQINVLAVGSVTSVNGQNGVVELSTANITESGNLYFTNTRARAAMGTANAASLIYYENNGNFQVNVSTNFYIDTIYEETATEGQNLFSITNGYVSNALVVYLNGILLSNQDYIANNQSNITLLQAANANDVFTVVKYVPSPTTPVTAVAAFSTINVTGQTNVVASTANNTLRLVAGNNIVLTTDNTNNSVTIASTASGTGVSSSNVIYKEDTFDGDGVTINFTLSSATSRTATMVVLDGLIQFYTTDYTISSNVLSMTVAPEVGEVLKVFYFQGGGSLSGNVIYLEDTFTGNSVANSFGLSVAATRTNSMVIVDGLVQFYTTDYTIAGSTLTFTVTPETGETIKVLHLQSA